ncbi:carbohydrate ABC transporter permease [Paenibacillus sp. IITD108]|uniref:carbohydrate ABC transporter permease n=1 Tax=Paenibacillus sp. IITD108 TaxID=3116649 RepID=UPI002F428CC6
MEAAVHSSSNKPKRMHKFKQLITPYLFVLPNIIIFSVFIVIPAILGFYYSLHKYDGLNPMKFIGLDNYKSILSNSQFWEVLKNTFLYAGTAVPLLFICSLGIALLLAQQIRFKGLFRAVYYWPVMISFIIVGLTWKWIFGSSFGILNYILGGLGLPEIGWLTDPFWAKVSVVAATLWSRIGFYMVIFIAGLHSIPTDFYEAARIDGASRSRIFFKITLPLLKPTSLLVLILTVIDAFKQYPLMYALTSGGPGKATTYMVQYIYEIGFEKTELGLASAMSVVLFAIIGTFAFVQFKLSKGGAYD